MSSRALRPSLVAALAFVVFTAACATRINNVLADPSRYRDRSVTVSGIVNESFSFAGRGAYQIEDESGSLWVVSDRGVPRRGARVEAKGTIREAFNAGRLAERLPINGVIMLEESHKAR